MTDEYTTCLDCGGRGYVSYGRQKGSRGGMPECMSECRECDGSGQKPVVTIEAVKTSTAKKRAKKAAP